MAPTIHPGPLFLLSVDMAGGQWHAPKCSSASPIRSLLSLYPQCSWAKKYNSGKKQSRVLSKQSNICCGLSPLGLDGRIGLLQLFCSFIQRGSPDISSNISFLYMCTSSSDIIFFLSFLMISAPPTQTMLFHMFATPIKSAHTEQYICDTLVPEYGHLHFV